MAPRCTRFASDLQCTAISRRVICIRREGVGQLLQRIQIACVHRPTAGTGSEVTTGSGVFDPESGIESWAGDPTIRPTVAICDPELNVSMPPKVTADMGTDAVSQAQYRP